VGEQRYQAVMAVLGGGRTVTEVARDWDVSRQTLHAWLARYEREGMEGMGNRSHRPTRCPHQTPALIEVRVLEMRRHKPFWGLRRLALELARMSEVQLLLSHGTTMARSGISRQGRPYITDFGSRRVDV